MSTLRSRLTYANVMSTIAIFLALGGGSMAAVSAPEQGVISDAQEQNGDPAGGASDGSSGGEPTHDGDDGSNQGNGDGDQKGGSGDDGDDNGNADDNGDGVARDDGDSAGPLLGVATREGTEASTDRTSDTIVVAASCLSGERVVGGGVRSEPQSRDAEPIVLTSAPDGDGWSATVANGSGVGRVSVTAYAICAAQEP